VSGDPTRPLLAYRWGKFGEGAGTRTLDLPTGERQRQLDDPNFALPSGEIWRGTCRGAVGQHFSVDAPRGLSAPRMPRNPPPGNDVFDRPRPLYRPPARVLTYGSNPRMQERVVHSGPWTVDCAGHSFFSGDEVVGRRFARDSRRGGPLAGRPCSVSGPRQTSKS
jgi:hypothetical protein